jgi:chromosome segregation ATPase
MDETVPYAERPQVSIREDPKGRILLTGLKQVTINSIEDLLQALNFGSSIRQTDATAVNARSSRSHAVFSLNLVQKKGQTITAPKDKRRSVPLEALSGSENYITVDSKLHFVDLAGSERLKNTQALGERAKEGISINAGLASLGKVISQLSSASRHSTGGHISYRDSKLTRLLQDSLGGNAITYMVACVNPAEFHLSETLNTVQYAQRARAIQIKPQIQQVHDDGDKQAVIERLRAEVQFLRDQIRSAERADRKAGIGGMSGAPQERAERLHEREMELQNQLLDIQENYNALSQRHAKLISEIAKAREEGAAEGSITPDVTKEGVLTNSAFDRLKRSHSFAEAVEQVVLEYEKTIQTLEASLSNTRSSLSTSESTLLEKESRLAYIETINSQLQNRLQKAMDREVNDDNYLRELENRVQGACTDEEKAAAMITSLKHELARVRETEVGAEDYISTLEERLAESEQQHELLTREISRLEHIVDRHRSINKLDTLLYELDNVRNLNKSVPEAKPMVNGNGHKRGVESESFKSVHSERSDGFHPVPEETEELLDGGAVQQPQEHDEMDHLERTLVAENANGRVLRDEPPSPAQTNFVNDKLETVTQELFDLRMEHEATVTDFDELQRKYQVALTSLAELQDALEDSRMAGEQNMRPVSMADGMALSKELETADDATEVDERELRDGPMVSHDSTHDELIQEVSRLRTLQVSREGTIRELESNYNSLTEKHQDTLDHLEALKSEVYKTRPGRASPSPGGILRRKTDRSSILSDRANRSFATLRNMVFENFETDPEKTRSFEVNINDAMTEFHLRSERVMQLEGELSAVKREMETKTTIIAGLTRERSSLKTSPIDMSALSSLESQLRKSETQMRSLHETHAQRERKLLSQINGLKTELEVVKTPMRATFDMSEGGNSPDRAVNFPNSSDLESEAGSRDDEHLKRVSQLQKEVEDWRSKHDSAMESMKASEAQLLATINDLETNLKVSRQQLEQEASRSVSPEEAMDIEQERKQHAEVVAGLQRELEEHKAAASSTTMRLRDLEQAHGQISKQVEEDTRRNDLTSKELETHRSLVKNLEYQIEAHKSAVTESAAALEILRSEHGEHLTQLAAEHQAKLANADDRLSKAIDEHKTATSSLQAELEKTNQRSLEEKSKLEEQVQQAKEHLKNLLADSGMVLNKPTNSGNLTAHIQALVNARKDVAAMHTTVTEELALARQEMEKAIEEKNHAVEDRDIAMQMRNIAVQKAAEADKRTADLKTVNEETLAELERVNDKEQRSARLVEELENQLTSNYDQTQAANNRLSVLQTERHEALSMALSQLDEAKNRIAMLEGELEYRGGNVADLSNKTMVNGSRDSGDSRGASPVNAGTTSPTPGQQSSLSSQQNNAMRKSVSPVNLPSPPPAIPLPPLPAPGVQQSGGNSPPPTQATHPSISASRHTSKDIQAAQMLVEDQEQRIRTIEKQLYAEKQLTATLEEALTDLESSGTKMKTDMEAWRRKCTSLEDELMQVKRERQSTRLSVQQMEDEARRRIEIEKAKLDARMEQLRNAQKGGKKKSAINCF